MKTERSRIHYTKPSITALEIEYAHRAAAEEWGPRCYDSIKAFEAAFSDHLGVKHAIATSSCTGAIHMGLAALGIGPGDEVILGDTNWIASAAPITYLGAKPVFVDVLAESWTLDPALVERAIGPRTKAIIAVHLYGNPCLMADLLEIGDRYDIPVIEDAAEAIGTRFGDARAGSLGAFGTFSFHGTKTITTGEGGMFVTQDDRLAEIVAGLANHGRRPGQKKQFWADDIGFKYKMPNVAAAIGRAQVQRIDELIARKRAIFETYETLLDGLPLKMNPEPPGTVNGYWMPTIVVDENVDFSRENLLEEFEAEKIDGRVFFWPLSMLPMFERHDDHPVSYSLYRRSLNLPSYHDLTHDDMERVVDSVRKHLG